MLLHLLAVQTLRNVKCEPKYVMVREQPIRSLQGQVTKVNHNKRARVSVNQRHAIRGASYRWRGGFWQSLSFFSLRYHHKDNSHPLMVDLEAVSKPFINFGANDNMIFNRELLTPRSLETLRVTRSKGIAWNLLKSQIQFVKVTRRSRSMLEWNPHSNLSTFPQESKNRFGES